MPTTYAHWRFGDRCIKTLPEELQEIINKNRNIFNFGVHGPDIFFYYDCLKHNDVNQFGTDLHDIPFGETLKKIKPIYKTIEEKEAAVSYILGFVCHFTLDSYCHGYIERREEVSKETSKPTTHGILESQLDKYFLIKDGYDPFKKKVTKTLKLSRQIGKVIGELFPEIGPDKAYKSISDQKFYLNLLKDSNNLKRDILKALMDAAKAPQFKDLLLTTNDYPELEDAMLRLDKLFEKAIEHYPSLADSAIRYLERSTPLDAYFKNHFCPKKDYKNIPILSVEAEKNYEVEIQE